MLDDLSWDTHETRRAKSQVSMMFKIIHGLVDIPAADFGTPAPTRTISQETETIFYIYRNYEVQPLSCNVRIYQNRFSRDVSHFIHYVVIRSHNKIEKNGPMHLPKQCHCILIYVMPIMLQNGIILTKMSTFRCQIF